MHLWRYAAILTCCWLLNVGPWLSHGCGAAETAGREPTATACFGSAGSPDTARAYRQFFDGNCEAAVEAFSKLAAGNTPDPSALYALGLHAASLNDYQKALELLCRAFTVSGNSPWAEYYLEELRPLLPYCHDPKPFVTAVTQAAVRQGVRPHVADLARALYGQYLAQRGDLNAAAEAYGPLHYVTRWALVGPFDNRDKAGFTTAYEPESGLDADKPLAGRNRQVRWYQLAVSPFDGRMNLAEIFEPRTHVLTYAACFVKAEQEGWRVLRVGCAGACAVWVNEALTGKVEQYNDYGPDKLAVPVYLYKGWNQVLVKSAVVENTEWAFSLRFCSPGGGASAGLSYDSSPQALAAYTLEKKDRAAPGPKPEHADLGLLDALEEALKNAPEDVSLLAASGALLDARNCGDKENPPAPKQLARAIALAPRCPYLRLKLAAVSDDSNEARHAAEAAYAAHPELPATLEALARLAEESQSYLIASDYARQCALSFGADSMCLSALILADALSPPRERPAAARRGNRPRGGDEGGGLGDRAEAYRLVRAFIGRHPYWPEAWERLADLELSRHARRAALQKGLSVCGGNEKLRRSWADELSAAGQDGEAAEFLAAGLAGQPFSVAAVLAAAGQFEKAGEPPRAAQLLDSAHAWAPENPDLLTALAVARHRAGHTEEALALFRAVLQLKPNAPYVKDYLAALDTRSGGERKFFAPYDVALKDLPVPAAEAYPNDNSVNILTQEVVRVNDNGSSSRMVHRVAKLLRPAGLRDLSQHSIYYEPARQVVDILKAAVITPDGRELSRADVQDRSTSAAMGVETRIYDEYFLKQVTFRDLQPGAMIDLQYTIRDTGTNIYGDYFAGLFYLSDDQPTIKCQYALDYPKSLTIQTRTFNTKAEARHLDSGDARREVVKWELDNTPGITVERGMPPVVDQLALLQVTTMRSWQEVGQWYANLAQDQLECTPEMRAQVQAMTRDCKTPVEKLRVIHDWVIRSIRYLGIEFGRNGYRPHKAGETFKALYGDCKDTAALITSLLKAVGIDAKLVLIRTVNAGAVPPDSLPVPNFFNHCIAYVPQVEGKDYWVDCTTDFNRLDEVPWADQNAQVLVVDAAGGKFMRIPGGTPQENLVEQRFTAKVERNGAAAIQLQDVRHGQWAPGYRELAETPGQYERYMKDYAARHFNGAELEKLELAPPQEQGPMWMKTSFKVPALAAQSGERKALPVTLDALNLSQRYAAETKRHYDLELYFPWERKTEIVYELAKGLKIASLPDEVNIAEPFGSYRRTFSRKDDTLTLQEQFTLSRQRVPVSDYEAFKRFCNRIDSLLDQKILLDTK